MQSSTPHNDWPEAQSGRPLSAQPDIEAVEHLLVQFENLETELEQVRQGLIHSHRLATLGTIASVIAHESNNILTPMTSYCQLALAQPDNHDLAMTAVRKSLEASERLSRISSSLLGFSREKSVQNEAPLQQTVADAVACLGREPQKDRIELHIDLPEVVVSIPALNLQQVILNLMLNAKKAMAQKGGQLRIVGQVKETRLALRVTDTGCGIPTSIAGQAFEPFVTMDHSPAGQSTGTGLGLSICRDLVRQAGGTIEVENTNDQGTTFLLMLPIQ